MVSWRSRAHLLRLPGARIEEELVPAVLVAPGEHTVEAARQRIERLVADPPKIPVVLDEPENRGLICDRVIDEVVLGERRDDQQRLAHPVATAIQIRARPRGAACTRT